jgi:hypothetical protein
MVLAACGSAMVLAACGSNDEPVDAGAGSVDGNAAVSDASLLDAGDEDASANAIDASPTDPDAMPTLYQLTVSPGSGGSISVTADNVDLGTCATTMVCNHSIAGGSLVMISANPVTLQHCTWTGACTGVPKGSSCFLSMSQAYSVGATFDAGDADCL